MLVVWLQVESLVNSPNQSPPFQPLYMHLHEVRPHKDHRGINLVPDALAFGQL